MSMSLSLSLSLYWWRWRFINSESTAYRGNSCCLLSQFLAHINVAVLGDVAHYWRGWLWPWTSGVPFYDPRDFHEIILSPNPQWVSGDGNH